MVSCLQWVDTLHLSRPRLPSDTDGTFLTLFVILKMEEHYRTLVIRLVAEVFSAVFSYFFLCLKRVSFGRWVPRYRPQLVALYPMWVYVCEWWEAWPEARELVIKTSQNVRDIVATWLAELCFHTPDPRISG